MKINIYLLSLLLSLFLISCETENNLSMPTTCFDIDIEDTISYKLTIKTSLEYDIVFRHLEVYTEVTNCFDIENPNVENASIENTWILLGFLNTKDSIEDCLPNGLKEMNITFDGQNNYSGNSCCNSFEGYYNIMVNNSILIDSLNQTLIGCLDDVVEHYELKYFDALKDVSNYKINGGYLYLNTNQELSILFKIRENN